MNTQDTSTVESYNTEPVIAVARALGSEENYDDPEELPEGTAIPGFDPSPEATKKSKFYVPEENQGYTSAGRPVEKSLSEPGEQPDEEDYERPVNPEDIDPSITATLNSDYAAEEGPDPYLRVRWRRLLILLRKPQLDLFKFL